MCETSFDSLGPCTWSGSEASGYCGGAHVSASPEPPVAIAPPPPEPDPYTPAVMLPMYLWSALTAIVVVVVFVLCFRSERTRPSGPRPDERAIKAATEAVPRSR